MDRRSFIKTAGVTAAAGAILPSVSFSQTGSDIQPAIVKSIRERIKPVAKEEHMVRIQTAQKLMAENKIDILLMEGGTSLNYYTGARWGRSERLFAMLLPVKGMPVFIAPKFEEGRAKEQTGDTTKVLCWEENESPYELIKKALAEFNLSNAVIGIEETTRYFVTENILRLIPSLTLTSATPVTSGCRSIKSAHEIELMQIANDIT